MTDASAVKPLLATRALSRSFGGLQAVRDVTLELKPGELHAVIGPNGAGKSTLVNLLSGSLRPTSGDIILDGKSVAGANSWQMTHLGIGRSFQRTNIFKEMTVLENVRLAAQAVMTAPARLLRPSSRETTLVEAAKSALMRTGLDWAQALTAGKLSHGAQRQLEISMALVSRPKVLLLDEPMAGMGPEESHRIATLLKELAAERAILLIEHDMDFVFAVADHLTVMVDGAVIASGKPDFIRGNEAVQRAYLGGHA